MNDAIKNHLKGLGGGEQPQPQAPGMTRVQSAMNNAVRCQSCSGEWFFEASLNKYSNMYSSMPGGDLNPLSQPQTIRICLCGEPFEPNIGGVRGGRTPNNILSEFKTAMQLAKQKRGEAAGLIGIVAEFQLALEAMQTKITTLEDSVRAAAADSPAAAAPKTAAPKTAADAEAGKQGRQGRQGKAPEVKE